METNTPAILIHALIFHDEEQDNKTVPSSMEESHSNGDNVQADHPIEPVTTNKEENVKRSIVPIENHNENLIYRKPENVALPSYPLTEANIYVPSPIDRQRFEKTDSSEIIEQEVICFSVMLYREFLNKHVIRSYADDMYIFEEDTGIYTRLPDSKFNYLINEDFGFIIEQRGALKAYTEIKEYVKKNHSLVVDEENSQPLQYWGFKNGLFDIYTGTGIVNDGRYFIRHVLQCNYYPSAVCPIFDRFLNSISLGDNNILTLLWEVVGYLLSNDMNAKSCFVFVGPKDTGKSLLAHIIIEIIGDSMISYLNASDFAGKYAVAELESKKLNVCMDLPNRPLSSEAVATIKALTGNDNMHSDRKFKESIHFKPTTRLLFGSNFLIKTETMDSAFSERMIVIPFRYSVPKDRQDFELRAKLCCEKAGIAFKAMSYYKQLVAKKYNFTNVNLPEGIDTCIDYNQLTICFAAEYCIFTGSDSDKIFSSVLYEHYKNYCFTKNITPQTIKDFSEKFNKLFNDKVEKKKIKVKGESLNGFVGIRLKCVMDNTQGGALVNE